MKGRVSLGDVCGLRSEQVDPARVNGVPYVGLEHIAPGEIWLREMGKPNQVKSSKHRFYNGDVLFGKLRPYLEKSVLAHTDGICSTDILVFAPSPADLDGEFLVNLTHTRQFIDHAIRTTGGVNHPRTSWSSLCGFTFDLPPLDEQRAIARALRAVQAAKDARRREIELERERKAALMRRLFAHGVRRHAPTSTPFGDIANGWQIVPLSDCAYVQTGAAKGRKLNGDTITVPYLRVANVQNGYLDLTEMKEITIRRSEIARYQLERGDVVMTEGGDFDKLGRGFIWNGEIDGCIHQNHVFAVRADRSRLMPEFLACLIQSDYGRAYFLTVAHKTTNLACINSAKLKRLPVPLPSLDEQREIASCLQAIDARLTAIEGEVKLIDELFRAMLEELMSGRLSARPLIESGAPA